ncbi:unnamed protein product [Symbiodinium sp. CCMP2592]|nr:unnamed protein product [Symbiodinium sp. CCMP2592]
MGEEAIVIIDDDAADVLSPEQFVTPPVKRAYHSPGSEDRRPHHMDSQTTVEYDADDVNPCKLFEVTSAVTPPKDLHVGASFLSEGSKGSSNESLEAAPRPNKKACPSACKSVPCKEERPKAPVLGLHPKQEDAAVPPKADPMHRKRAPPPSSSPAASKACTAPPAPVPKAAPVKACKVDGENNLQTPSPKVAQPVLVTPPAPVPTRRRLCKETPPTEVEKKIEPPAESAPEAGLDEVPHEWVEMAEIKQNYPESGIDEFCNQKLL